MRALNAIHAALRPSGVLLDIHPEPEHAQIEIHLPDRVERLGAIDQSAQIGDIQLARAVLRSGVDARQWTLERVVRFEVLYHFESVDAWLRFQAERRSTAIIPASLLARARELLAADGGELRQVRSIRAARLRRV